MDRGPHTVALPTGLARGITRSALATGPGRDRRILMPSSLTTRICGSGTGRRRMPRSASS